MSKLRVLEELVAELCREDHVGLWSVVNHVRDVFPQADTAEIRRVTLGILDELLERRVIQAGFPTLDGRGFEAWTTSPAETIDRVEDAWESLHRDPDIGEIVWFTARETGPDTNPLA